MSMLEGQGELMWMKYLALFLIGPWDIKLAVLVAFFLIDLSSGAYAAQYKGQYSSMVLFEKTRRKFYGYMVVVISLNLIDIMMGFPNTTRNGALVILILNELFSIATNLGRLGHKKIEKMLKAFYEDLMNHNAIPRQEEDEGKGQEDEKKQRGEKDEES